MTQCYDELLEKGGMRRRAVCIGSAIDHWRLSAELYPAQHSYVHTYGILQTHVTTCEPVCVHALASSGRFPTPRALEVHTQGDVCVLISGLGQAR